MSEQKVVGKNKKKLIINIILYVISGLLLSLTITGIIIRLSSNGSLYIFDNRIDVVLTDSMSSKNEKYIDFLKGHDNQIQPFDLVVSRKVHSERELEVYDIVLFNNPGIGVDTHRIVAKDLISKDTLTSVNARYATLDGHDGVCLYEKTSSIISSAVVLKEMTIVTYFQGDNVDNHFYFSTKMSPLVPEVTSVREEKGILTTYKFKVDNKTAGYVVIDHQNEYDYSKEIIVSCDIVTQSGNETLNLNKEYTVAKGSDLVGSFNRVFEYETRGDKSNTSDGKFRIESIISEVTVIVPKLGYVVRYLTSVWGIVMFTSIGVIIIVFDIISSRMRKKEKLKENTGESDEEKQESN